MALFKLEQAMDERDFRLGERMNIDVPWIIPQTLSLVRRYSARLGTKF